MDKFNQMDLSIFLCFNLHALMLKWKRYTKPKFPGKLD